jgi:hypothetical protein
MENRNMCGIGFELGSKGGARGGSVKIKCVKYDFPKKIDTD